MCVKFLIAEYLLAKGSYHYTCTNFAVNSTNCGRRVCNKQWKLATVLNLSSSFKKSIGISVLDNNGFIDIVMTGPLTALLMS